MVEEENYIQSQPGVQWRVHKVLPSSTGISSCTDLLSWKANQSDLSHFCFTELNPNSCCWDTNTHHRLWVVTDTHRYPQHLLLPPCLSVSRAVPSASAHEDHPCTGHCDFGLQILILFTCSSETEAIEMKIPDNNGLISLSIATHAANRQGQLFLWHWADVLIYCVNFFDIYT